MKKIISTILALIISFAVVPMQGFAEETDVVLPETAVVSAETVLYEADFSEWESEHLPSDLAVDNAYVTQTLLTGAPWVTTFDNNRDKGMMVSGHLTAQRVVNVEFKTPIKTGVHKVSFDFSPRPAANVTGNGATATDVNVGINMTSTWEGKRLIRSYTEKIVFAGYSGSWFDANDTQKTEIQLDAAKKYTLDIILDFGSAESYQDDKSMYYLDGELVHTLTGSHGSQAVDYAMASFNIPLSGYWDYFDNLKISTLNNASTYSMTAKSQNFATGYIDVEFPTAMNAENAVFTVDNVELSSEQVEWKAVDKVRLTADSLKNGGTHTIDVSDITDVYGVAPASNTVAFETVALEQGIEEVLYENTFDKGWSSVDWANWKDYGEYEGLKVQKGSAKPLEPITIDYNGNRGLAGKPGNWPTATQLSFDFTKQGKLNGIDSGVYKFSWDLSLGGMVDSCDACFSGINMKNTWESNAKLCMVKDLEFRMYTGTDKTAYVSETFDKDKVYAFDAIVDFDNDKVYYYLDGVFKTTRESYTYTMNSFDINFCQCIDYFDNLKITKIKENSFGVESLSAVHGNDYIDIYTTELAAADITADKVTINGVPATGVEVLATAGTADNNARYVIRATMDGSVQAGEDYAVALSSDIKNVIGKTINAECIETSAEVPGISVEISNGQLKAVILNNEDSKISPVIVVASYDGENRMTDVRRFTTYKIDGADGSEIEAGKTAELSQDISDLTGTVKGFIFNDWSKLMPLADYAEAVQ